VAWERRGGNLYYYRCEREGGRVRKRYVGTGELAERIAHADATIRRTRTERRKRAQAEIEEAEGLASMADELNDATEVLARAEMLAAGYHRRKGEWRRRRDA
jgi:hypothetical protein